MSKTLTSLAGKEKGKKNEQGVMLHDLLCIQENNLTFFGDKFQDRIPTGYQYDVIQATERGGKGLHNQVIYNKSIFEVTSDFDEHLEKAYALMDYRQRRLLTGLHREGMSERNSSVLHCKMTIF